MFISADFMTSYRR